MSLALELWFGIPLFARLRHQLARGHPARHPRHHLHQPAAALDAADLDRPSRPAVRLHRRVRCPARSRAGRITADAPERRASRSTCILFGAASTVVFSLIAQIGEQVDFLRFLPPRRRRTTARWWIAYLSAGPGWIVPGLLKLLAARSSPFSPCATSCRSSKAAEPTQMYLVAFQYVFSSPHAGARLHLHVRHHLADQDQRHQCLCGLDRLVELLLAPDPQPSRAASSGSCSTSRSRCC